MHTADLVTRFAGELSLPIDVNSVVKALREECDVDIQFIGVDFDPDILQGHIKIFYSHNVVYDHDPRKFANIYYHRGHGKDWQRLVCCKELMHLLDPAGAQTSNTQAVHELAEKIGLPPEMQDPLADRFDTNIDRVAEYKAAAILLPMSVREQLLPAYTSESLRLSDIATLADMPRKYVALVMSDVWPQIHDLLTSKP